MINRQVEAQSRAYSFRRRLDTLSDDRIMRLWWDLARATREDFTRRAGMEGLNDCAMNIRKTFWIVFNA